MATWYIDPTATYNGDGTLSTPASGAGLPGAWNALVAVMTNNTTYPINGGDIVYIRSADSVGNDLVVNVTATFTMATRGSDALPVFWILDNGTIWTYDGTLTMNVSNTVVCTFAQNNWLKGFDSKWVWLHNQGNNTLTGFRFNPAEYEDIVFRTANSNGASFMLAAESVNKLIRFIVCTFDISQIYISQGHVLSLASNAGACEMYGCVFDLTDAPNAVGSLIALFSYSGRLKVVGGSVINGTELTKLLSGVFNGGTIDAEVDGFDTQEMALGTYTISVVDRLNNIDIRMTNIKNDKFSMRRQSMAGYSEWIPNENYPTLNAILPDGINTPWSIKCATATTLICLGTPLAISNMTKFYDITPATRTITIELLICDTYPTTRKRDWWALISYVDNTTGLTKTINTFSLLGDLETSTAEWSATVYGAKTYEKFKIVVETPTAIRQYSDIVVELKTAVPAPSLTDFYFVDPEYMVV